MVFGVLRIDCVSEITVQVDWFCENVVATGRKLFVQLKVEELNCELDEPNGLGKCVSLISSECGLLLLVLNEDNRAAVNCGNKCCSVC